MRIPPHSNARMGVELVAEVCFNDARAQGPMRGCGSCFLVLAVTRVLAKEGSFRGGNVLAIHVLN